MRKSFCSRSGIRDGRLMLLLLAFILVFSLSGCVSNGFAANDKLEDSSSSAKNAVSPPDQMNIDNAVEKPDTGSGDDTDDILNGDPGMIGYVMDMDGGRMLVVSSEVQDFSSTGGVDEFYDAIWFSDAPDDVQIGEKVKVWFDAVAESYPAQSQALKTEKVAAEKPQGSALTEAEAIQKALESDELESAFLLVLKSIRYEQEEQKWVVVLKDAMESKDYEIIVEDSAKASNTGQSTTSGMVPVDAPEPLKADDDLQLGALKVKMTKDEAVKSMKAALLRSEKQDVSGIPTEFLYYEDGTVIHFVEGEIYSIEAASADYTTPRGLKVGDTVEQLRSLYGEPERIDEAGVWVYSARGYDLFFVTVVDDTITAIKVSLVM